MPTVEYLETPTGYAATPPHWGPPWSIAGWKVVSRKWPTSLLETSESEVNNIGNVPLSWVIIRIVSAVSVYAPLTTSDKAMVSVSPPTAPYDNPPVERSVFITFPDSDDWNGVIINVVQFAQSPTPGIGTQWATGGNAATAVPGVFSRDFRTLKLTALGSYAGAFDDVRFAIANFEWDFNGETVLQGVNPYSSPGYYYGLPLTREFPNYATPGGPIRLRAIGVNNVKSAWTSVKFNPIPIATAEQQDNETFLVDGTDSFDPDGSVVEWEWAINGHGPFTYTEPTATIPFSSIPISFYDGQAVVVDLRIKDNDGLIGFTNTSFIYRKQPEPMGLIDDAAGLVYAAVNVSDTVEVAKFTEGLGTREVLHVIPNAKNPGYTTNPRTGKHYVSYEDRATKKQMVIASVDGGQTWQ